MELLGVGPTELLFIIVIALIVLGPKDLAKTGKTVGKWLNGIIHSDTWQAIRKTSDELRHLPTQLMREDNLEKFLTEDKNRSSAQTNVGTWSGNTGTGTLPPRTDLMPESKNENTIHPPITLDGPPVEALKPAAKKPVAATRKKPATTKKSEKKPVKKTPIRAPRKKSNA